MISKRSPPGDSYAWSNTRVVETLWPPAAGTARWRREHGIQLVCVRYRYSPDRSHRYTTIELLVDHAPVREKLSGKAAVYELRPAAVERALERKLQASGAHWDSAAEVWRLSAAIAKRLKLGARVSLSAAESVNQ